MALVLLAKVKNHVLLHQGKTWQIRETQGVGKVVLRTLFLTTRAGACALKGRFAQETIAAPQDHAIAGIQHTYVTHKTPL